MVWNTNTFFSHQKKKKKSAQQALKSPIEVHWWALHEPLTHLSLDKMTANSQTTFSNALAYMYEKFSVTYFLFEFHWHLFLMVQVNIGSGNVLAPNRRQLKSHYLNECGPNMLTRMCGTKGSWVNHVYESLAAVCHQLTGPRSLLRYPLVRD